MKHALKIYRASQRAGLLLHWCFPMEPIASNTRSMETSRLLQPTNGCRFVREFCCQIEPELGSPFQSLISLFTEHSNYLHGEQQKEMSLKVSGLKDEILACKGDSVGIIRLLEEKGRDLLRSHPDGSAFIELLKQLQSPQLALEVFNWRREQAEWNFPLTSEEYAKGITVAGRCKNVNLALDLFNEAGNKQIKTSSTYNALMGAYMSNGLSEKCQLVFESFKKEVNCTPNIVTFNILISVFGRLMLMDHMEATFQEIHNLNLSPTLSTYNNLMAGYVTAWMWDRMEHIYMTMRENSVEPNINTYLLMLRGYSHSGNLKKMELIYDRVRQHVDQNNVSLIRSMICTYSKSSDPDRIRKIEALLKLIPEEEYKPWMNVWLIKVYAQEDLLEMMERCIDFAFVHQTCVTTVGIMRSIITTYFRCNAVDKLAEFVKRAEVAGWRICRSLYHCEMVMYSSQNRLGEMENVLTEMENVNIDITKKTLVILYKAYSKWGPRCKLEQIVGLMCKQGYGIFLDGRNS